MLLVALACLLSFVLAQPCAAHGGVYVPPTWGSGPTTGGPGKSGGTTTGRASADLADWAVWWEFNKAPYMQLRLAVQTDDEAVTGDIGFFTGRGSAKSGDASLLPDRGQIENLIRPALERALDSADNRDTATAALLALARIGEAEPADPQSSTQPMLPHLRGGTQEVRETAALALGLFGEQRSLPLVFGLLRDTEIGRKASGLPKVDPRTRTFAAYGLGLIASETEYVPLRRELCAQLCSALPKALKAAQPDLAIAIVSALGQAPLPPIALGAEFDDDLPAWSSLEAQIELQVGLIENAKLDPLIRAHAPIAAARLIALSRTEVNPDRLEGARLRLAEALLSMLDPRRSSDNLAELRQSAAQALGRIGDSDGDRVDQRIRERLIELQDPDRLVERFALISLGRIGANPGYGEGLAGGRPAILTHLLRRLEHGSGGIEQWAALALGVLQRDTLIAGGSTVGLERGSEALLEALRDARATDQIAAFAIANGIHGHAEARPLVEEQLDRVNEPTARGHVLVAVGLLRHDALVERLRKIAVESEYRPELLRQTATALALMGDKSISMVLAERIGGSSSIAIQAAAANALGLIGDRRAVEPLIEMLQDESGCDLSRAFAAVALGLVADRRLLPWTARYSVDTNYSATVDSLNSPTGNGILNLL